MILEVSGKIGKRRGEKLLWKVVVVCKRRMNGKDGNRDGDTNIIQYNTILQKRLTSTSLLPLSYPPTTD